MGTERGSLVNPQRHNIYLEADAAKFEIGMDSAYDDCNTLGHPQVGQFIV
jgi:hypothetical protein